MKILYDHQTFAGAKFGGIPRYFYELIKNSSGLYLPELSGVHFQNEYLKSLKNFNKEFFIKANFRGKDCIISKLNTISSLHRISASDYNILHATYYDLYYLDKIRKPLVITIHDMVHEMFLRYFYKKTEIKNKRILMGKADKIIAVSKNTKNDILKIYPEIDEHKIHVIYHGNSFIQSDKISEKKNYILYVGERFGYKNFDLFVNAVSSILIKYDLDLVCTGSTFSIDEELLFEKLGIKNRVKNKFVSEDKLKKLYEEAICFVYPSLYEGFGIPILEAFASNCPCLLSNASCFPEVAGDAVEYFDPKSLIDICNAIEKVVSSPALQNEMILKGQTVLQKYSWKKCAEEHAKIYKTF